MDTSKETAKLLLSLAHPTALNNSIVCCACRLELDIKVHTHKCFDCKRPLHAPLSDSCKASTDARSSLINEYILCSTCLTGIFPRAASLID